MSENTAGDSEVNVSPEIKDLFNLRIKDAGGVIREPREYDLPKEYDLSAIPEGDRSAVNYFIKKAEEYLSFPSVYVASTNPARDKFKANLERQAGKVYGERAVKELDVLWDRNKLRNNRLRPLVIVSDIAESAKIPQVLVDNLMISINETLPFKMGVDRKKMSQEEKVSEEMKTLGPWAKIQQAEKISNNLVEVLRFMGKKS